MQSAPVLILSLALIGGLSPGDATAQTDSTLTRAIARQKLVRIQVGPGTTVELQQPRIEGPMLVGQVGADGARAEYPIQGISQVWRRGSAAGVGFKIGALVGAAAGGALGAAVANFCPVSCSSPSGSEELVAILGGGLLGGVTVGGLGALFGAMATRWKSVHKTRGVSAAPIVTTQRLGVSLAF